MPSASAPTFRLNVTFFNERWEWASLMAAGFGHFLASEHGFLDPPARTGGFSGSDNFLQRDARVRSERRELALVVSSATSPVGTASERFLGGP